MEMLIEKTKETYYEALQESGISKNAGCARRSAKKAVSAQKGFRSFEGIKTLRLQILAIKLENVNGGILIYEGNWDSQKN